MERECARHLTPLHAGDGADEPRGVHAGAVEIVVVEPLGGMGRHPALEPLHLALRRLDAALRDRELLHQMLADDGVDDVRIGHGGPLLRIAVLYMFSKARIASPAPGARYHPRANPLSGRGLGWGCASREGYFART
jgi:hypothetical protein